MFCPPWVSVPTMCREETSFIASETSFAMVSGEVSWYESDDPDPQADSTNTVVRAAMPTMRMELPQRKRTGPRLHHSKVTTNGSSPSGVGGPMSSCAFELGGHREAAAHVRRRQERQHPQRAARPAGQADRRMHRPVHSHRDVGASQCRYGRTGVGVHKRALRRALG